VVGARDPKALVLSNNADGFPHLFIRSDAPIRALLGTVEARWLTGGLTESEYFDQNPSNDLRKIAVAGVTLDPKQADGFTVWVARAVYDPTVNGG
jgi:hypothetical protein